MAQASRWRSMKRRAAIATATAASSADSRPTSDRKRSARSSVARISGRPFSSDSMRTPFTRSAAMRALIHCSYWRTGAKSALPGAATCIR